MPEIGSAVQSSDASSDAAILREMQRKQQKQPISKNGKTPLVRKSGYDALAGIAGPLGIPMWAFYVNRGQAIASFGVQSKDTPIMEFQPANKAYQMVPYTGFRTFIKTQIGRATRYYEPFSALARPRPFRQMFIGANDLALEETSGEHGLRINVLYFTLPGEPFAALVRQVAVQNTSERVAELEIVDGLPVVIPFGVNNALLKEMGRTVEAWMAVFNLETAIPFYRVQATVGDEAEVETFESGHFYLPFAEADDVTCSLLPIVDPAIVFGANTSLSYPDGFLASSLEELQRAQQITTCRTPCGMAGIATRLAPGATVTLVGLYGHVSDFALIERECPRLTQPAYIAAKHAEARALAEALTAPVATHTSNPHFDAYCRQSLLDNILRGGYPTEIGGQICHIYGRKHGDLERDYNAFYLAPEYYSQGNANYRDVNQNRRNDVWLYPAVGDFNVLAFLGLIQADGYNPLVVLGSQFNLPQDERASILESVDQAEAIAAVWCGRTTSPLASVLKHPSGRREKLTRSRYGASRSLPTRPSASRSTSASGYPSTVTSRTLTGSGGSTRTTNCWSRVLGKSRTRSLAMRVSPEACRPLRFSGIDRLSER